MVNSLPESPAALDDLRVVDLTDETGVYAAKLFADLGADVIRVEPVAGDPMRGQRPLFDAPSGAQRSLPFLHYNANKRSLALDLETGTGRAVLDRLLVSADVLIESYEPADGERLGLTRSRLGALNPALIHTSVTGFGLEGPHRDYRWSDLVAQAMSGLILLTGFPEDPPVRIPAGQAYHQASFDAAIGAMALVLRRDLGARDGSGGRGGHVEISMQDSLAISTFQTANLNHWTQLKVVPRRFGTGTVARAIGPDGSQIAPRRTFYRCLDGWAIVAARLVDWERAVAWLTELGYPGELADPKYDDPAERTPEAFYDAFEHAFARHPVERVYHTGQAYGLLSMPVRDVSALFDDEQLAERGFLVELEHPELGTTLTYAGAPYLLSATPWRLRRPAPEVGEHSAEILVELGYSDADIDTFAATGTIGLTPTPAGSTR